mgnify:CR=1 FL=1
MRTRALLLQSGLAHKWWREAAMCFPYLRNITVVIDGNKLTEGCDVGNAEIEGVSEGVVLVDSVGLVDG